MYNINLFKKKKMVNALVLYLFSRVFFTSIADSFELDIRTILSFPGRLEARGLDIRRRRVRARALA